MLPLKPQSGYGLLRCPICRSDLSPAKRSLVCANAHRFDLGKSGYVNLMAGRLSRASAGGDTHRQLERREAFLSAGHFDFIAEAIACHARAGLTAHSTAPFHVLDAGCGTGYHLGTVIDHLCRETACGGLGIDISKDAARLASRRRRHLAFAVTDIWRDWPIRSHSVDLLINIFAPKNFSEMARVLRPEGLLVIAYPAADHLAELRREFGLMTILRDKARLYAGEAQKRFHETWRERRTTRSRLRREDMLNAILMGPNATRLVERSLALWPGTKPVTFDVELLFARSPRARSPTR